MRNRAQGQPGGAGQYRRPVPNLQNTPKDARDGNGHSRDHLMRGTGRQGLCRETGHRSAGRGDVSLHKADKWLDAARDPRLLAVVVVAWLWERERRHFAPVKTGNFLLGLGGKAVFCLLSGEADIHVDACGAVRRSSLLAGAIR